MKQQRDMLSTRSKCFSLLILAACATATPEIALAQQNSTATKIAEKSDRQTSAKKKKKDVAKYETYDVDLFVTTINLIQGKIVAAQLTWLPPSMVSLCMGRSVYNCEEVRFTNAYQLKSQVKKITGSDKELNEKDDIPPVALSEWVSDQEPRYYGSAKYMLEEISKLPEIRSTVERLSGYYSINQSLEPLQVQYGIRATVGYEPWDDFHQFRIIKIHPAKY